MQKDKMIRLSDSINASTFNNIINHSFWQKIIFSITPFAAFSLFYFYYQGYFYGLGLHDNFYQFNIFNLFINIIFLIMTLFLLFFSNSILKKYDKIYLNLKIFKNRFFYKDMLEFLVANIGIVYFITIYLFMPISMDSISIALLIVLVWILHWCYRKNIGEFVDLYKEEKQNIKCIKDLIKSIILFFLILIFVIMIYGFILGKFHKKFPTSFQIIAYNEKTYAIVYKGIDQYVIVEAVESSNSNVVILLDNYELISKQNIELKK